MDMNKSMASWWWFFTFDFVCLFFAQFDCCGVTGPQDYDGNEYIVDDGPFTTTNVPSFCMKDGNKLVVRNLLVTLNL